MKWTLRASLLWVFALGVPVIVYFLPWDTRPSGWERVHPTFSAPVYTLLPIRGKEGALLAGCGRQVIGNASTGGLLRSDDFGRHWENSSTGLPESAEVTALADLVGWAGDQSSTTILAGTRAHGIFFSTDDGRSWQAPPEKPPGMHWSLVNIQALAVLEGDKPTIAIGSNGQGILISQDEGATWQARNQGLTALTIQALTADGPDLIAGTWFGGIYRSQDAGLSWNALGKAWEGTAVAALRSGAGRLWIGLQSGELLTALPGGEAELYSESELDGAGITAIDTHGQRLVVGTDCRGVAIGNIDGDLAFRNEGLDNLTITAVLDEGASDGILIGTWNGFYLSKPPPGGSLLASLLSLGLILLARELLKRWRNSIHYRVLSAYNKLDCSSVGCAIEALWAEAARAVLRRDVPQFFSELARRLENSADPVRNAIAPVVRLGIAYPAVLALVRNSRITNQDRAEAAAHLNQRATALEELAQTEPVNPSFLRVLAQQDRVAAAVARSSSLPHLSYIADDIATLIELTRAEKPSRALIDPGATTMIHKVAQLHSQLALLPPEDRALMLGRALSEVLVTIEEVRSANRGLFTGVVMLEILRQILIDSLRDLRQRAEIHLELKTQILPSRREALVVIDLVNTGQGHASNIDILLLENPDLKVLTHHQHLPNLFKQQKARLEFLVESRRAERVRLAFQLRWDDLEMAGHQAEFADVAELRQGADRASTFRPLRPNPYVVGRPLRESDVFIGREETFARIATCLEGAHQDNVVVLMGQRRMGKTSVLRQLKTRLEAHYVAVLVDLQGILGQGEAAFLWEISAAICDGLEAHGITVEEPSSASFSEDAGWYFRHHFLKPVCQKLGERRLLLAFDEFEVLAERIAAGDLSPRILPYFRSLMQHEDRISFLFAGTHRLDQLTGDYWGALFNLAIYLEIGHLHGKEVEELFVRPTRESFEIDPLALDKAVRATGGHPHFSQLVAREMVDLRNEDVLDYITIQDMNRIVRRVVQKGQLHIAYLWDEASLDERLMLLAVHQLLSVEGSATLTAARDLIESRYPKSASCDLALALKILLRKELLAETNGQLELRIDLLRTWMEQNRSVVDEAWAPS